MQMLDVILIAGLIVVLLVAAISYFTNPFTRFSIVRDPNKVTRENYGILKIVRTGDLNIRNHKLFQKTAKVKSGWHIVSGRFVGGKKVNGNSTKSIIKEIHRVRFNPDNPFIISGDHFSVLYPRSLGIFYHTLLDSRTALDAEDWDHRQQIYAKTTSYAIEVFAKARTQATTIVPIGRRSVVLMNIYTYPADTLYSLIYALRELIGKSELDSIYKFESKAHFDTHTKSVGKELINEHRADLAFLIDRYVKFVLDKRTGLIRKNRLLSGTKDMAMRKSAFYDNIVLWKMVSNAQQLGILKRDQKYITSYKKRILEKYWNSKEGYFNEDLNAGVKNRYSSDWLIAYQTGFISPYVKKEQRYFEQSVSYIQENAIDQPFAIKYHNDYRPDQLYLWVKRSAKEYGSTTIWSHWGIEYIKVLLAMAYVQRNSQYLSQAKTHLDRYAFNIIRYKGYPEVYNEQGDMYKTLFYKSVLRTGWVVNYEEAVAMYKWTKGKI